MKYLAWDIEIKNEIPEDADWQDHRPLGITCAATLRSGDIGPTIWIGSSADKDQMNVIDLLNMIDYIKEQREYGFMPLTWNGLGFDFAVLAEESNDYISCADLAYNHIDMMYHFLKIKGFPLGLETAAVGLGVAGKTEGMSGNLAPPMWANNTERLLELERPELAEMSAGKKRKLIVEYVAQDVKTTLLVAESVDKQEQLPWISRKGRANAAQFPNGWLTVKQARKLRSPKTSWMTDPLDPETLIAWVIEAGKKKVR